MPKKLKTRYKPGHKVPASGQYAVYVQMAKGARFKYHGQTTCVRGEPFPPCAVKGVRQVRYEPTDLTRHSRKRGR